VTRVCDDSPNRALVHGTTRLATANPSFEVLSHVPGLRPQGDETKAHARHPRALGEDPGISARGDVGAELQVDGVGIEVDPLDDVLRARLHVAGGDPGLEARPATDHRFDPVRPDHDARPARLVAPRAAQPDPPAAVGLTRHTGRLGAHAELGPEPHGALGETSVEPGTIENPTDIALGDLHLRVVGCDEHAAPDLPGHPGRAVGIHE